MSQPDLIIRGALWQNSEVDLLVQDGTVVEMIPYQSETLYENGQVVDAKGKHLFPSFIDAHVHLREPGFEYKEDIASGLKAAAHGGFGAVMPMASTSPVNDNSSVTDLMLGKAAQSWANGPSLYPVGALTKGLEAKELAPMAELAEAGCVAFSNDGLPVLNTELFRHAMEYAADLGMVVIDHCEDPYLAHETSMNESALSGRLGLKGQPTVAESMQVARDVMLAGYLNIPIHLAHISCRESVELIAWAKSRGVPVTAETAPHYLVFDESELESYSAFARVNPPLRSRDDVLALRQALRDGTIDMLATDHAPHAAHEKEVPVEEAPNGISGLDTAVALCWKLIAEGELDQQTLIRAFTTAPASTFKLPVNTFARGDKADFFLFDGDASWVVSDQTMYSKGKNTPCQSMILPGRVCMHYLGGKRIV